MRGFGSNKVLGLAIGERGVTACELTRAGGAARANAAEFVFPAGVSADDPAALGQALRDFLREQHISARRAVIGLPLKWAVVKPKEIPPTTPAALADLLRLQAERDFAMEPQDLVLEYAGEANPAAAGTVLLLAVPRKRVDAAVAMAEAAGLGVEAVTLSAVALAQATAKLNQGEGAVLHVASGAAELAVQHRGHPRVLRHMRAPVAATSTSAGVGGPEIAGEAAPEVAPAAGGVPPRDPGAGLALELRQVLSLMPQNGTAGSGELVLWDGVGLGDAPRLWSDSLGVSIREQSLDALGVTAATNGTAATAGLAAAAGRFAPAAALGLLALERGAVVPDLLDSRLIEKKPSRLAKPLGWGIAIGCVLLFAIGFAVYDLSRDQRKLESNKQSLGKLQPGLKTADAIIARATFAQRWQDQNPKFLTVLRDLTADFPNDAQIWATRVTLQDDGRGTLDGQATSGDVFESFVGRLQGDSRFKEVKVLNIGEAGKNSRDVSFSVTFRFTAPPPPGLAGVVAPATSLTTAPTPATNAVNTSRPAALDKAGPATQPGTQPSPTQPAGDGGERFDPRDRRERRRNRR